MDRVIVSARIYPLISYDQPSEIKITHLNFVHDKGKGKKKQRCFWHVSPNGNYGDECLIGKAYALEALQYMIDQDYPPLLNSIIQDMPPAEQRSGIEIGFNATLAEFAMIGAVKQSRGQP